ncbi:MAG: DUF2975 domain-containing protein [Pseudomonadota bacterium]
MGPESAHKIGSGKKDQAVPILIKLLVFSQWALVFLLVAIPLTALGAPFFPLRIGGDPNDPDAQWPTGYIGAVFDEDMTQAALYAEALVLVIFVVMGIYVIRQMLGVLRNVLTGNPFVRDNGVRLRRMGYAGVIAQFSVYGIWILVGLIALAGWADFEGISVILSPAPWVAILLAFALATVFRDGAELKEEQDLTV